MDEPNTQDPRHEEIIQPVKPGLEDAGSLPPRLRARERRPGRLFVGVVLAALVTLAVGVFFVLPDWVAQREQQAGELPVEPEPLPEAPAAPTLSADELARLQEQAEALLADLLSQQARLEELSVATWGAETWTDYEAAARAGDDAYLANAFQDAVPAYRHALELGEALLARSVDLVDAAMRAGTAALEAGNAPVAQQQFTLVLEIEAENEPAKAGLRRAERLPEVLALTQQAEDYEGDGALEQAAQAYGDALAIDRAWSPARTGLADVERRIRSRRFEALMSQGFAALANEEFDDAYAQFTAALELRPTSEEAVNGRLQAEQGQRLDQIGLAQARALAFERRELWEQAIAQYESALDADATLIFAQEGLERTRRRADLDSKLSHLLGNPNLLFDDSVLAAAQALLADAQGIAEAGPRLVQQRTELDRLLRLASTPIPVELQSDELTEVTVYRVGPLGTFAQTTLELRPGTYTAVGSRDGYRDVRETFTILPGKSLAPIRVECIEPI